jgi:hypothetical protein
LVRKTHLIGERLTVANVAVPGDFKHAQNEAFPLPVAPIVAGYRMASWLLAGRVEPCLVGLQSCRLRHPNGLSGHRRN